MDCSSKRGYEQLLQKLSLVDLGRQGCILSALKHSGSSGDKSSSTDTGDPSSDESSSGEDPLDSGLLVDGDKDGDGSDPHGESLLGNGASSQDAGDTVSSNGATPTGIEDLYQQRFKEGYDLFDPDYILWLEQHHQEALPADRYTLTRAPSGGVPGCSASSPSLSSSHPITP